MCGRYASTKSAADVAGEFHAADATEGAQPGADYNVAPTKPVLAVVARHPRDALGKPDTARTERTVRVMRWGLVPAWAKDPALGSRMINARAETAAEKPTYRKALQSRRCLLPADGWYEWQSHGAGAKQPFYVTGTDGAALAMAGLWEFWRPPGGGEPLVTAAVLTTDAVGPLSRVHHRMPLLLPPDRWADWLDPDLGSAEARVAGLLTPPSERLVAGLAMRPVSTLVNNVRNQGPELMEPAAFTEAPAPGATGELALDLT